MSQNIKNSRKCLKNIVKFLKLNFRNYIFFSEFKKIKRFPKELSSLSQQCAAVITTWSEITVAPQPIRGIRAIHLHESAVASWPPFEFRYQLPSGKKSTSDRKNEIPFL